jgi:hypothetical protein
MNRRLYSLGFLAVGLSPLGACQSEMHSSSSSHWFVCEDLSDCAAVDDAVACSGGYCVAADGERIEKGLAGNGGSDSGGSGGGPESGSGGTPTGGSASGGSESSTGGTDGVAGAPAEATCEDFDALRGCSVDDDCTVVQKQLDCCGSQSVVGIATEHESEFSSLEGGCYPTETQCACPASAYVPAEDGRDTADGTVDAVCVQGLCESRVDTRSCGDALTCDSGDLCLVVTTTTGPSGTTEYSCVANPCAGELLGCSCADDLCAIGDGHSRACQTETKQGDVLCEDMAQ